ncbi:ABC transporter permease [Oscillibacter sp. MSJ-2]|uniref:ABC transporter permease n=1 Tax=Dysosmobacter acutus TaxID=2841504 RepID=A0ABS6F883_9FIRM|nr:ABC transporter permease [Dysosmobacter acutus]MBU5626490.1 ABC transporter permease [Dysosmobacter acutus]
MGDKTLGAKIKSESYFASVWNEFRKNKAAVLGMAILLAIVFVAVFADVLAPHDPYLQVYSEALQHPSSSHIFGTDEFGRDIFSRVLYGARVSLLVGVVSVAIACVFGSLLGASAGYFGGAYDAMVMRCMDVLLAIPSLLLNLSIVAALGKSVFNMMLAVGVANIPRYCRIMRASVLQIKNTEYVDAARTSGASHMFIILRHIIPNCLAPIIVQATLSVGSAIIACAGLSFLGVGIPAPTPEWGAMLSNGKEFLRHNAYITIFPGLAIMLTVLSLNLMGDGLRDAFDPKLRR